MPVRSPAVRVLIDAAAILGVALALAFATNALRAQPLPLVAAAPYQTLVPCPEALGEVSDVSASDPLVADPSSLVVDARSAQDFAEWHAPRALSIPFDFLEPTPTNHVNSVAASRARRVIVYGDGQDPDSGRELGRELSGKGIRNVSVIKGGAPALRAAIDHGGKP